MAGPDSPETRLPPVPSAPRVPERLAPIALDGTAIEDDATWSGALVSGADGGGARGLTLRESRAEQLDLTGAALPRVHLLDAELVGGSLANARLAGATARRAVLRRVRLTGLQWTAGTLDDVRFDGCRIDLATFAGCRMRRVTFDDCLLTGADLQDVVADEVRFDGCDLREVDLSGARFRRCAMTRCDLEGARALDRLSGVAMPWADVVASAGTFAAALGVRVLGG
jgi:uncharacterized protein YjbI with pentapeptide repeats